MSVPIWRSSSRTIRHAGSLVTLTVVLMLALSTIAAAEPPLQEWRHFENLGVPLPGASRVCGFPVFGDFVGEGHFIVFRDASGAIVREVDTFPALTVTIYSAFRSYSSAAPAVLTTYYTGGAAIGTPAIAVVTGLVEKAGDADMNAGREVWDATVIGMDAAGVPLIRFTTHRISTAGPDWDTTLGAARCAAVR